MTIVTMFNKINPGKILIILLFLIFGTSEYILAQFSERSSNDNPGSHWMYGVRYGLQGNFKAAQKEFKKASELEPGSFLYISDLELVNDVLEGKIKGKIAQHLFKAIDYAGGITWELKGGEGRYYLEEANKNAINEFNAAIDLDPQFAISYLMRGNFYENQRDADQAIVDYNKAIEINPKYALAYFHRGIVYQNHKKQYELAIADFNKAIEIDSGLAVSYYNKALACESSGRIEDAIEAWKNYIEHIKIYPQYAQAIELFKQNIEELEQKMKK